MYCKSCGTQLQDGSVFCTECGAKQSSEYGNVIARQKVKKPIYKKWWFWLILFVIGSAMNAINSSSYKEQEVTIDAALFDKNVKAQIFEIDTVGAIGEIKTRTYYEIGFVSIYLSDSDFWENTNEVDRKDFLKVIGDLMVVMADKSVPESFGGNVGVETTLYSTYGTELGKRTVTGDIKLS